MLRDMTIQHVFIFISLVFLDSLHGQDWMAMAIYNPAELQGHLEDVVNEP